MNFVLNSEICIGLQDLLSQVIVTRYGFLVGKFDRISCCQCMESVMVWAMETLLQRKTETFLKFNEIQTFLCH